MDKDQNNFLSIFLLNDFDSKKKKHKENICALGMCAKFAGPLNIKPSCPRQDKSENLI